MPRKSGLRRYLESTGVLDWGTDEQIEQAKKLYTKMYHKRYKKRQRIKRPEVTLSLSFDDYKVFEKASSYHRSKLATFIRDSALAYLNQIYLVPNENTLVEIREYLSKVSNAITQLREEATYEDIDLSLRYDQLLGRVVDLEEFVRDRLEAPKQI